MSTISTGKQVSSSPVSKKQTGVAEEEVVVVKFGAKPLVPSMMEGAIVVEHRDMQVSERDLEKAVLISSRNQYHGKGARGHALRKELQAKASPVLNACALDYYLEHPKFIPTDCASLDAEGRCCYNYCWGTIYKLPKSGLVVRGFFLHNGLWRECFAHLELRFDSRDRAVILAS